MRIYVLKGKHGDRYYRASTPEEVQTSSLKILKENHYMGYYYDEDKTKAEKILEEQDGKEAYRFVMSRTDHEYEEIYTEELE